MQNFCEQFFAFSTGGRKRKTRETTFRIMDETCPVRKLKVGKGSTGPGRGIRGAVGNDYGQVIGVQFNVSGPGKRSDEVSRS